MSSSRTLGIPSDVRKVIYERDDWSCLRCGVNLIGRRYSIHHRFPRRMGGTRDPRINDVRNLVLLCGDGTRGCHGWIESNRLTALRQGWLLHSLDEVDVPVLNEFGQSVRLLLGGTRVYLQPHRSMEEEA